MRSLMRALVGAVPDHAQRTDAIREARLAEQRAASALQVGALMRADHQVTEDEWDALACRYAAAVLERRRLEQERIDLLPDVRVNA